MTADEEYKTCSILFLYIILIQVCKSNVLMLTLTQLSFHTAPIVTLSAVLFIFLPFLPKSKNYAFEFLKRNTFHKYVRLTGKRMGEED